jgi:hypothetical protein
MLGRGKDRRSNFLRSWKRRWPWVAFSRRSTFELETSPHDQLTKKMAETNKYLQQQQADIDQLKNLLPGMNGGNNLTKVSR